MCKIENLISNHLFELGLTRKHKGCVYLTYMIEKYLSDPMLSCNKLCDMAAVKYKATSDRNVYRLCNYAIKNANLDMSLYEFICMAAGEIETLKEED